MPRQPQAYDPRQEMRRRDFELQHKRDLNLKDVALHHHGFYEVYFLLTGDVTYLIENKLIHVMPGDILLIPPRVQHQVLIRPEMAAYERYVLWVDPQMLGRLSSADTDLTQRFSPERIGGSFQLRLKSDARSSIRALLDTLDREINGAQYGADLLVQSLLAQLLVTLDRLLDQGSQLDEDTRMSRVVAQVIDYVNLHYAEPLSLDSLAERFFVSKFHLSHEFNRQVGTSLYRYIRRKRLLIARQLLDKGQKPSTVAAACGFSDYTGFFRAFKADYGLSPREYAQGRP